jgi:hydroxymethylbilane synthase
MRELIIGTRGSALALAQAAWVASRLREGVPELAIRTEVIRTTGDANQVQPLSQVGDKGLFTRQIEAALLAGRIHIAVHSLKDLPTVLPPGLVLGAVTQRQDVRDALISASGLGLDDLPAGARVGTSSLRRAAQLLAYRPDLRIVNIRGNVDTRLHKALTAEYDAVVLAAAGLTRLGLSHHITQFLPLDVMLPAVGQGALALEIRADDASTGALVARLEHKSTRLATDAERAFLTALGGGCQVPIAALGEVVDNRLRLRGLVATEDGKCVRKGELSGNLDRAEQIGRILAEKLMASPSVTPSPAQAH